eukprot:g1191.t1
MDVVLTKQEIVQVGPISSRHNLVVLPRGKRKMQSFVVGDDRGTVRCFKMKGSEAQKVFEVSEDGQRIRHVSLGGPKGSKDRIFYATHDTIVGISKKGKPFFKLKTNSSESVRSMFVEDAFLWTVGDHVFNIFENGKDVGYYNCTDKILSFAIMTNPKLEKHEALLGCESRNIRILRGSECIGNVPVEGSVSALHILRRDEPTEDSEGKEKGRNHFARDVVYGTKDGTLGMKHILRTNGVSSLRPFWSFDTKKRCAVNMIQSFDITGDGREELIVGYESGVVQVLAANVVDGGKPAVLFEESVGESIRALSAGAICSPGYVEIVATTYSGRVVSFTTENVHDNASSKVSSPSKGAEMSADRIRKVREDLARLREQVKFSRSKLQEHVANGAPCTIRSSFDLLRASSKYVATIEAPTALDVVILRSSLPMDDISIDSETNATMSRCEPEPSEGNHTLMTFRCEEKVSRLHLHVGTIEGQYGAIEASVITDLEPRVSQTVVFNVKPLSLHFRIPKLPDDRALNTFVVRGNFSIRQIHEWISLSLPEVPSRPDNTSDVELFFENSFVGSVLECSYRKGEGRFSSDNLSTIATVKEAITKFATDRKIRIRTSFETDTSTTVAVVELVHPKICDALSLKMEKELVTALREIESHQRDAGRATDFFAPEYVEVLRNSDSIEERAAARPKRLQALFRVLQSLYVDINKFKGRDVSGSAPALLGILKNYDKASVLDFFQGGGARK